MVETYAIPARQLKTCPFCGGEPRQVARLTRRGWIGYIKCGVCEAQSKAHSLKRDFDVGVFEDDGLTRAAYQWQRRTGGGDK